MPDFSPAAAGEQKELKRSGRPISAVRFFSRLARQPARRFFP